MVGVAVIQLKSLMDHP